MQRNFHCIASKIMYLKRNFIELASHTVQCRFPFGQSDKCNCGENLFELSFKGPILIGLRKCEQMYLVMYTKPFCKIKNLELVATEWRIGNTIGEKENLQNCEKKRLNWFANKVEKWTTSLFRVPIYLVLFSSKIRCADLRQFRWAHFLQFLNHSLTIPHVYVGCY